jgi:hypothetical protein
MKEVLMQDLFGLPFVAWLLIAGVIWLGYSSWDRPLHNLSYDLLRVRGPKPIIFPVQPWRKANVRPTYKSQGMQ